MTKGGVGGDAFCSFADNEMPRSRWKAEAAIWKIIDVLCHVISHIMSQSRYLRLQSV